jgi:manganese/zinc/iron transport system permease protein
MLTIHLYNHEGLPEAEQESQVVHLQEHLRWQAPFAAHVVDRSVNNQLIKRINGHLELTDTGRQHAQGALLQ